MTQAEMIAAAVAQAMAAFVPATQEPVADKIKEAAAKRRAKMAINKDALQEAEENVSTEVTKATATPTATLYALREAAVSGYGATGRYAEALNREFGNGWPLLKKADGANAAATWEKVEQERRSFIAMGKARNLTNPNQNWMNVKKSALLASGHNKKGPTEARTLKVRFVETLSAAYVAFLREAAEAKQPANVTEAAELMRGALLKLGADIDALKAKAAKPLPGKVKGA
jgi:hypothetical protein